MEPMAVNTPWVRRVVAVTHREPASGGSTGARPTPPWTHLTLWRGQRGTTVPRQMFARRGDLSPAGR
jgi:hypothetical protein